MHEHEPPHKPQHQPHPTTPQKFEKAAQEPTPKDESPKLKNNGMKNIQCIIDSILYYARAVDMAVLPSLSTLAT